jgi:hypothetical protein
MNCKNCLTKLVWLAGALLILSVVFPDGPAFLRGPVKPVTPVAPVTPYVTDATISKLLATADVADRNRINGVYEGLAVVLKRDNGQRIRTTEQWADLQANTLQLAITTPGKYPGLDVAIEKVFEDKLGGKDALPSNPDTVAKLIDACKTIASSAVVK